MGHKSYENIMECSFDPERVIIYQRKEQKNGIWYVRILRKSGGYLVRSCKTKRQALAETKAKEIWMKLLMAEERNIIYGKTNFNQLYKEFVKAQHNSQARKDKIAYTGERWFIPFFGRYDIQTIENDKWEEYLNWRISYWSKKKEAGEKVPYNHKTPSQTTLLHERQVLRQFLNWAKDNHYLHTVPRLRVWIDNTVQGRNVKSGKTRGRAMTPKRYKQIDSMLRREAFETTDTNRTRSYSRFLLYYLTKTVYHSLIRPIKKEMGTIRWKNVEIRPSKSVEGGYVAIIALPEGKRKNKPMMYMTTFTGTKFLLRWRKYSIDFGLGKDNDYVFPKWDGRQVEVWMTGHRIRQRLIKHGLRKNEDGTDITLYSFRATGITQRIKDGHDIGAVSKAANTSITSISQSYHTEFMRTNVDRFANNWPTGKEEIRDKVVKREQAEVEDLLKAWNRI